MEGIAGLDEQVVSGLSERRPKEPTAGQGVVMTVSETDTLAELIRQRQACLRSLRDLGRRQLELIEAGELSYLLTLLAGKQRLLTQLQDAERALDPFRQQDPASRTWRSAEARQQCARLAADCDSLLAEIVDQEREGEAAMSRRRDQTAASLEHVHSAGAARGAYAAEAGAARRHLDLSSEG
jgi:hypothetical protein